LTVRALAIVCNEPQPLGKSKPRLMPRRDATAFRRKFLASLTRQQGWTAGDALDFQRDLQLYEELLARAAAKGRARKPLKQRTILRRPLRLSAGLVLHGKRAPGREPGTNGMEGLAAQVCVAEKSESSRLEELIVKNSGIE